jgi:hypothetical protein
VTACGLARACKPLNETWNLPSKLCRDAKTDGVVPAAVEILLAALPALSR